jgi:hypothetical protein
MESLKRTSLHNIKLNKNMDFNQFAQLFNIQN